LFLSPAMLIASLAACIGNGAVGASVQSVVDSKYICYCIEQPGYEAQIRYLQSSPSGDARSALHPEREDVLPRPPPVPFWLVSSLPLVGATFRDVY
jgi:hypothetical protein